ncbi:type II toxin-antitoxin system RelE/ParE family toxin [Pseudomonas sp. NPDC086566]|uniref:type II toxin-antitoxin system RelE/ParE family toxin n=1 Tax=Pseudomonas sp. NPDC086566 TaxID=3390647 RepID=UPI003D08C3CA
MNRPVVRIAAQAQIDIADTLRFTQMRLGESVNGRYKDLLQATFQSLADDPLHIDSTLRDDISSGLRSLHLGFHVLKMTDGRIIRPRHIVFYRTGENQVVEILRVLHDAMEVSQHLKQLLKQ